MDLVPRAAIHLPHLEDRHILFRCPSNMLNPRLHRCGRRLGTCASVVKAATTAEISLSEYMSNSSEGMGWDPRLYVVSYPILVNLRTPWKAHS